MDLPFAYALPAAIGLFSIASIGWLLSLRLPNVPAADSNAVFPRNGITKTIEDLRALCGSRRLIGAAAGIVFFWGIAAVAQLNVDQYAFESGATTQGQVTPLLLALVIGIGGGSLLAGRLSGQGIDEDSQVNLGIVPGFTKRDPQVALIENNSDIYQCRWVNLKINNNHSPWLKNIDYLHLPIAHQEGKFIIPKNTTLPKFIDKKQNLVTTNILNGYNKKKPVNLQYKVINGKWKFVGSN